MLLVPNMTKKALDKSSNSIIDVFLKKFGNLSYIFNDLDAQFISLLDTVHNLQDELKDITSQVKHQITEMKEDWVNSGLDTTPLDEVERIIDEAERELSDLEREIDTAVANAPSVF